MTELDLDALERELLEHPAAYIHTGPGLRTLSIEPVRTLIQRLREVEADRDEWKQKAWDGLAGGNIVALGMQVRIAQLERVREAAIEVAVKEYFGHSFAKLHAALAAVEEK